jgi:hypothetical protein
MGTSIVEPELIASTLLSTLECRECAKVSPALDVVLSARLQSRPVCRTALQMRSVICEVSNHESPYLSGLADIRAQ